MGRLPWNRHIAHSGGHDEGGMEHLETDVMRFMAILAFCLVAIFALVQSMPLDAPAPPDAPVVVEEPPVEPQVVVTQEPEPAPEPVVTVTPEKPAAPPEGLVIPTHKTVPASAPEPQERVVLVMPKPQRPRIPAATATSEPRRPTPPPPAPVVETPPATTPVEPVVATTEPPEAAPEQKGFSLRFDSETALRQLVARDEVALYALANRKAWRVMLVNERLSFRPARVPGRFHEMTAETVPVDVVKTLRRLVTVSPDDLTWGVTLPVATSRQLSEFLSAYDSGGLVIDASGDLRLEQG